MTWIDKKSELISNPVITDLGPLFTFVEFNLSSFCNRNCEFCPLEKPRYKVRNAIRII